MAVDARRQGAVPRRGSGGLAMLVRVAAVCGIVVIASASVVPIDEITIVTRAVDQLDDNRFFTRVGGTLLGITDYAGLEPGETYTLSSQLVDRDTGALVDDAVFDTFTAAAPTGTETVEIEIAPNRTESNIYLALVQVLYDGEVTAQDVGDATALASQEDVDNVDQTIEVHAIQSISVSAVDAADGDAALPPEGGTIVATVDHANLVAGYSYTVGGQLLTPSGQSTGIFANVPLYQPADKDGTLTLEFPVGPGFEGQRLVPSVGLFHQNRVTINAQGGIDWIPGAPQPVMIASDPALDDPSKTVAIGTPFDDLPSTTIAAEGPATTPSSEVAPTPTGRDTTAAASTDSAGTAVAEGPSDVDDDDGSPNRLVWFGSGLALGAVVALGASWLVRRT
jgi:hypothetical protein